MTKRSKSSPTSQSCHQHISSPTPVTNIDVAGLSVKIRPIWSKMTSGKIIANTLRQMNIRANALVWAKVRGQGKWILFSIRKFSGNGEINHKLYDGSPDENFQKFSFENFHDDSAYTDRNGNSLLELIIKCTHYEYKKVQILHIWPVFLKFCINI